MNREILMFAKSLLYGVIMMAGYDVFRILRRIIRHNPIWVIMEDLVYWISGGLFLFSRIYRENSGILRGYIFIGLLLGMILWHYSIGEYLVRWISGGICFLVKRLKFFIMRCKITICKHFFRKL